MRRIRRASPARRASSACRRSRADGAPGVARARARRAAARGCEMLFEPGRPDRAGQWAIGARSRCSMRVSSRVNLAQPNQGEQAGPGERASRSGLRGRWAEARCHHRRDTPTLHRLRVEGVDFQNSHAVFPTVTRVNAATLATGTQPGTHGIVGNQIFVPDVDPARRSIRPPTAACSRSTASRAGVSSHSHGGGAARGARTPAGRGQLGLDGQRLADEPQGAGGGRGARQRVPGSGPARGVAGRCERGDPREVRGRAAEGPRGGALRRGGHVDPAGAPRVRAAGAGPGRRHQLDHRARPHAARPGRGSPAAREALRHADREIAQVLAALDGLGLAGSTDVFVASDHGFTTNMAGSTSRAS